MVTKPAEVVIPSVVEAEEPEKLQLIVHRGSELAKTDIIGKSDPYVLVQYQDKKFKSKTVKSSQNPVWDFVVDLPVYKNKADKVSISVFDSDIGKDDTMGTTVLGVPELLESGNVENRCIKLDKCKSGLLYVSYARGSVVLTPVPAKTESLDLPQEKKTIVEEVTKETTVEPTKVVEAPSADDDEKLCLVIHRASELQNKGLMGKSDPYVVVKYQDQKYKSKTVKNNQNPVWDFVVNMKVNPKVSNKIDVIVYDKDIMKDDIMGSAVLDVQDLLECGIVENKCIDLNKCKSGKLHVSSSAGDLVLPEPVVVQEEPTDENSAAKEPMVTKPAVVEAEEPEEPEKLQLIVHRGSELAKTDIIGKSDPYVLVQYQDKKFKSKTVKSSQNPVWDFVVDLPVYKNKADKVSISVFDSDIGKDDTMGTTVLGVPELLESGNVENRCIKLDKCKSGLLYVSYAKGSFVLTPAPAKTEKNTIVEEETNNTKLDSVTVVESTSPDLTKRDEILSVKESIFTNSSKVVHFEDGGTNKFTLPIPLKITVHRGYGLTKTDLIGYSDPYVVIKNGNQTYKSKVIQNSQNPVWDFEISTNIENVGSNIEIDIFDEDVGNDDHMGSISLSPLSLITSGTFSKKCFKLQKCKAGDIFVSTSFQTKEESPVVETNSIVGNKGVSGSPVLGSGTVHVHILEGKNLEKKDMIGKSDPFIIASMNDTFHRSASVKNDQNPKFNYDCSFEVQEGSTDKITIEVFDEDFGNMQPPIGELEIDPSSIMRQPMMSQWLQLYNSKSGHLLVSAEYQSNSKEQSEVVLHKQVITESSSGLSVEKLEGTIALHILRGKKLEKKDIVGKSDPFLLINFGEESLKSKTVDNSQDPLFDYKCHFDVTSKSPKVIKVEVYDEDYGNKNDFMGEVILNVEELKSKSILLSWVPLDKCTSGEIQLSAQFRSITSKSSLVKKITVSATETIKPTPETSENTSILSSTNESTKSEEDFSIVSNQQSVVKTFSGSELKTVISETKTSQITGPLISERKAVPMFSDFSQGKKSMSFDTLEGGSIALHVLRGRKLEKKDIIGKSDPFLLISYDEECLRSKTIENSQEPLFDYKCHFDVTSKSPKIIKIEMYDEDYGNRNDYMGEVNLNIEDLKSKSVLLTWVPLINCKSGELQLSAQYKKSLPMSEDKIEDSANNSVKWSDIETSGSTTVIQQMKTSQFTGPSVITEKRIIQASEIPEEFKDFTNSSITITTSHKSEPTFETKESIAKGGSEFSIPEMNKELSESHVKTVITAKTEWSEPVSVTERHKVHQGPNVSFGSDIPELSDVTADSNLSQNYGMVSLHIHRARNLVKMDIIGKSDPFIVVTVNDVIYRSETINNNLNPVFDYKCQFEIGNTTEKIKIELFDEDYIKDSDFMGEILLDLTSLKYQPILESWIPLSKCAHGEIQLSAKYEALPVLGPSEVITASPITDEKENIMSKDMSVEEIVFKGDIDHEIQTTMSGQSGQTGVTDSIEESDLSFCKMMSVESGSRTVTTKINKWSEPTVTERTMQEFSELKFPEMTRDFDSKTTITKVRTSSLQSEPTVFTERSIQDGSQFSIPEISDFSSLSFSDFSNSKTMITKVRTTSLQSQPTIVTERQIITDGSELSFPEMMTKFGNSQAKTLTASNWVQPNIVKEECISEKSVHDFGNDDTETTVLETKIVSIKSEPSTITKTLVHSGAEEMVHQEIDSLGAIKNETLQSIDKNGSVSLHIHKGRNLVKMDIIGKSDPYIVVTINGETFRSETVNNNLNPEFDFKCYFDVGDATEAKIEIWDEDYIKDSDFMGEMVLNIKPLKEKSILETWIPLDKCDHGEILISAQFTEFLNESFTEEAKFQSHNTALSSLDSKKEDIAMQLENMGIQEIRFKDNMSEESEEKILLEHVSKLQKSTSSKIDNLMKTVKQADASFTSQDDLDGFTSIRELDNCGNMVTTYSQRSTVTKTILDGDGNVIEQVTTSYKDPSSSESDTSPTLEDVIYKEYPHLSKPFEEETTMEQMSRFYTIQKYYHCSNQPFENISSLRAHFVQPFYAEDDEVRGNSETTGISMPNNCGNNNDTDSNSGKEKGSRANSEKDEFKDSPIHFPSNLAFQIGKFDDDIESGLELLSSNATFTPRIRDNTLESGLPESVDFGTDKTLDCQSLEYVQELELDCPNFENKDKVNSWIQPVISGTCLQSKLFWKTDSPVISQDSSPVFSQESLPPTIIHSKSTDHSPRSPTSIVKSISLSGSVHSLPASPIKKISTSVRKLTSESFSSEHDISKSLEIVYVEPDIDPKEELTAHYRTASPSSEKKFEKRKPSYTQLKRPVSYDLRSDSPNGTNSESGIT